MSLDTSLRSAERSGDWRAQVTSLRRAGRFDEAVAAVEARRAELEPQGPALLAAVDNEGLMRATERPALDALAAVSREILETGDVLHELRAEQAGRVMWRCPAPRCNHHEITSTEAPVCQPCAEEGKWVRMERAPAPPAPRTPRRRRSR